MQPETVRQVEYLNHKFGVDVPLILMNSFETDEETCRIVKKYEAHNLHIYTFVQSCWPVLHAESMLPVPTAPFQNTLRYSIKYA